MGITQSFANDAGSNRPWAVSLGVWGGIPVRVHLSVALAGVGFLYAAMGAGPAESQRPLQIAAIAYASYWFALVAHVAGHLATIRRLGLMVSPVTIVPWGEREVLPVSRDPEQSLWVACAGVLANLVTALVAAAVLPLFPDFRPEEFLTLAERTTLLSGPLPLIGFKFLLLWNLGLALVNLFPAPPFDGSQAVVRIVEWIDPDVDPDRWKTLLSLFGWGVGAAFVAVSPFLNGQGEDWICPPMWGLLTLGIVQLFAPPFPLEPKPLSSRKEPVAAAIAALSRAAAAPEDDDRIEVDFSPRPRPLSPDEQALVDDRRVDEILAKLHEKGMQGLSPEETEVLRRVSQRYQKRRTH